MWCFRMIGAYGLNWIDVDFLIVENNKEIHWIFLGVMQKSASQRVLGIIL